MPTAVSAKADQAFSYRRTFLLGTGFMSVSVVWGIYNTFLPPIYDKLVSSTLLVGLIMTIDNILALVIQPWVGAKSDRTWTRFGRRLPYVMVGMPLAGVLLLGLPTAATWGLGALLLFTVGMNIGMAVSRTPIVSLMADLTPSRFRSSANGVINLMGGVGGAIALFLGRPLESLNPAYPFYFAAVVALLIPWFLRLVIKEPRELPPTAADDGEESIATVAGALRAIVFGRDKSGLLLLFAIFSWFIAFAGSEALFSLYGQRVLGITPGEAGQTLLFLVGTVILFAVPAGWIGQRIGRRRAIMAGLFLFGLMFLILWPLRDVGLIRLVLPVGGVGWSLVVVNSLPMVLELGRSSEAGAYTGTYYVASMSANIAGPPLLGGLMDVLGDGVLFLLSALFLGIALVLMSFVRRGEAAEGAARPAV